MKRGRDSFTFLVACSLGPGIHAATPVDHAGRERTVEFRFDPDVLVLVNAPATEVFANDLPVRLVVYALPNGNTIPQTIGRQMAEGLDWHYDIQHIGAQTRLLRASLTDCNLVVAYVQAAGRSWPHWRRSHEASGAALVRLVDRLRSDWTNAAVTVELTAHSGGGSLLFGFIEAVDRIPDWVRRFVWLDANYAFDAPQHCRKLADWLRGDARRTLGVYAYDDRDVRYNGKPIVSATGGTYRRTMDMVTCLTGPFALTDQGTAAFHRQRDARGRIELIMLHNPDRRILHTVMVERNGFIHGLTLGTPWEDRVARFWTDRAYTEYIQAR